MIKKSQENQEYINKRSGVHEYVKSLMKDLMVEKRERLNKIYRSTSDKEDLEKLKEERTAINDTISNLDINQYTRDAKSKIEKEFPSAWENELVYIYEDYSKYKKETKDASDDVKALKSTLDDADTILAQYKTALQKLKKSEYLASGGNPMMMDPFGMSMGMVDTRMMEAMQDDYKIESMKEMIKYSENEQEMLDELSQLNNSIIDTDTAFANLSISFVLVAFSVFVSYKLINNTLSFKSELFNGKLYGEGVCYN